MGYLTIDLNLLAANRQLLPSIERDWLKVGAHG
jgi:hypothetical protein